MKPKQREWGEAFDDYYEGNIEISQWNNIKSFISSLLQAQHQQTLEMIENHKFEMKVDDYLPLVKAWKGGYDQPFDDGYNYALQDIIKRLTGVKE